MVNEARLKGAFKKVKEDMEGIKNELAFTLKRVAKIEEVMTKMAISGDFLPAPKKSKKSKSQKIKRKIIEY